MTEREPETIRLALVPSTMDALHDRALLGAPSGTAVVAAEQTEGRGSRGRGWSSPPGGLWVSVLSRPSVTGLELASVRAGLAVAEALDRFGLGGAVRLKWPNDLMLADRKVGGILCEARWHGATLAWVAIGLGLNVTNRAGDGLEDTATNLASAEPELTAAALTGPVIEALRRVNAAAGPLSREERTRFRARDWLLGRTLAAPAPGVADGLEADGSLRVRGGDGTITAVRNGTVVLAGTSAMADPRRCS